MPSSKTPSQIKHFLQFSDFTLAEFEYVIARAAVITQCSETEAYGDHTDGDGADPPATDDSVPGKPPKECGDRQRAKHYNGVIHAGAPGRGRSPGGMRSIVHAPNNLGAAPITWA